MGLVTLCYRRKHDVSSNSILMKRQRDQTNIRFGTEFRRCVERMTRMIKDMTERQNSERAGTIMEGKDDDETEIDLSDSKASLQFLSARDIYMRVAQNLELIDLYF